MNVSLRSIKNLSHKELIFIFIMMEKYTDVKFNNHKKKGNKKIKKIINHDNCTTTHPCLYDFNCLAWNTCKDEKFLQYRLIMKQCEK